MFYGTNVNVKPLVIAEGGWLVDTGSKGILVVSWFELSIWIIDGGGGGGGGVNVTSDGWLKGSLLSLLFD